jgi:hypothetical protein
LHCIHQATCLLLDKRILNGTGEHTWGRHAISHYEAWTKVSYDDAAGSHTVAGDFFPENTTENGRPPREVLWGMNVGSRYPLWIDDQVPGRVLLSRGSDSPWVYLVPAAIGSLFALVGAATAADAVLRRPHNRARPAASSPPAPAVYRAVGTASHSGQRSGEARRA